MENREKDSNEKIIQSSMESMGSGLMEVIVDTAFSTDGILKDIPIVSTGMSILNTARAFKDQLFAKKLLKFLEELTKTTLEQRRAELEKIESDSDYKIKVGEKLLYIIDRNEDHEAASRIGKLFAAYINHQLTYNEFLRASSILNNLNALDFEHFLSLEPIRYVPSHMAKTMDNHTFVALSTQIEEIGTLVFSGLYLVSTVNDSNAILVFETDIAKKLRMILKRT